MYALWVIGIKCKNISTLKYNIIEHRILANVILKSIEMVFVLELHPKDMFISCTYIFAFALIFQPDNRPNPPPDKQKDGEYI